MSEKLIWYDNLRPISDDLAATAFRAWSGIEAAATPHATPSPFAADDAIEVSRICRRCGRSFKFWLKAGNGGIRYCKPCSGNPKRGANDQ